MEQEQAAVVEPIAATTVVGATTEVIISKLVGTRITIVTRCWSKPWKDAAFDLVPSSMTGYTHLGQQLARKSAVPTISTVVASPIVEEEPRIVSSLQRTETPCVPSCKTTLSHRI
jgi:hypothetical protein